MILPWLRYHLAAHFSRSTSQPVAANTGVGRICGSYPRTICSSQSIDGRYRDDVHPSQLYNGSQPGFATYIRFGNHISNSLQNYFLPIVPANHLSCVVATIAGKSVCFLSIYCHSSTYDIIDSFWSILRCITSNSLKNIVIGAVEMTKILYDIIVDFTPLERESNPSFLLLNSTLPTLNFLY